MQGSGACLFLFIITVFRGYIWIMEKKNGNYCNYTYNRFQPTDDMFSETR